ncbi:MAG: prepilin-type N-terminal cleavage/methylation domain-containing protein [bacterium]
MPKTRKNGFTMIEAIIIVGILAIIAGILTPLVIQEVAKSKVTQTQNDMEEIGTAFVEYHNDTGFWPHLYIGQQNGTSDFGEFECLYENTYNIEGWDGPYLDRGIQSPNNKRVVSYQKAGHWKGFVDPWGQPYTIIYTGKGSFAGGKNGCIAVITGGPDKFITTTTKDACNNRPNNDDLVRVITKQL